MGIEIRDCGVRCQRYAAEMYGLFHSLKTDDENGAFVIGAPSSTWGLSR